MSSSSTITAAEAKRLVQVLLVEKKTDFSSDGFRQLIKAAGDQQNRATLLVCGKLHDYLDIHVPLGEYYLSNVGTKEAAKILQLAKLLSSEEKYSYSLATTAGFIKAAIKYFEKCIEKTALLPYAEVTHPDFKKDVTLEEQFYIFNEAVEADLLLLHSQIFANLLANTFTCKWVGRNLLPDLRYAFMVYSAVTRGGQGVSEEVGKRVLIGLGHLLVNPDVVVMVNKNTYIANWFFYRLFEVTPAFDQDQLSRLRKHEQVS